MDNNQLVSDRMSLYDTLRLYHPMDFNRKTTNEDYHKMARLDTNTKLRIVKREIFSRLQRDESLIQMILIDLLKEGSRGSATVESFRRHKKGALGSELLAELKQAVDLESIVVQRCWELMGDEWFEECVKNVDLSH